MERTSTTAVTLFPRLVYSDLNQSGLSQNGYGGRWGRWKDPEEGPGYLESEGEEGAVWDVVTWDPVEQEGEGDHMEGVGVGSVQPQLWRV